jgi:hypothetical protein
MRLAYASASSVSLQEDFARPLVIGYLGFDLPVYRGGRLGAPVATTSVLLRHASPPATLGETSDDQRQYFLRQSELAAWLAGVDPDFGPPDARAVALAAAATLGFEAPGEGDDAEVVAAFWDAADAHVAREGDAGARYAEVIAALDAAVEERRADE